MCLMELDLKRLEVLHGILPFNPRILIILPTPLKMEQCLEKWPLCTLFTSVEECMRARSSVDFLWLGSDLGDSEMESLFKILTRVKAVYSSSTVHSKLQAFLEQSFSLFSEWKWDFTSNAVFLEKKLLISLLSSLNYLPKKKIALPPYPHVMELEKYLKPVKNKSLNSTLPGIDFIYLINLDERPEKYEATAAALQKYHVQPCRFSAINGQQLSTSLLGELGFKIFSGMGKDKWIGSIYKEFHGQEYISNEIIGKKGVSYFSLGMSRGAIGCLLSHLSVLKDAYDSGYQTIWVMEDDAQVLEDPHEISGLIKKLDATVGEDWDVLFTDSDYKGKDGSSVPCRSLAARPNFPMQTLDFYLNRFYPVSIDFFRVGMRYGTYSMVIRKSGMEKILSFYKRYSIFLPYDMDYWLIDDLKMYASAREIVSTLPGAISDNV